MVAFEKARRWIRIRGGGGAVAIEGIYRPFSRPEQCRGSQVVRTTEYPRTERSLITGIGFPRGLGFLRGLWEYLAARTRARAEVEKARIALEKDRDRSQAVAEYIGLIPDGAELMDLEDGTGRSIWIRKASGSPASRRAMTLRIQAMEPPGQAPRGPALSRPPDAGEPPQ